MAQPSQLNFVRTQMLPPQAPPVSEAGAVKWVRENLFSSPLNTILTVLGVLAIGWLAYVYVPWWMNGVWVAGSLGECRDIVLAKAGEGAEGPCWAMIRERWHQFIFGFYPTEEYWRPILAFGLLFAALAPVLFAGQKRSLTAVLLAVAAYLLVTMWLASAPVAAFGFAMVLMLALLAVAQTQPGRLLWFTVLYAVFVFWLLWGGPVWAPVAVLLGFGVLAGVFLLASGYVGTSVAAGIGVVAAVVWWLKVDAPFVAL